MAEAVKPAVKVEKPAETVAIAKPAVEVAKPAENVAAAKPDIAKPEQVAASASAGNTAPEAKAATPVAGKPETGGNRQTRRAAAADAASRPKDITDGAKASSALSVSSS